MFLFCLFVCFYTGGCRRWLVQQKFDRPQNEQHTSRTAVQSNTALPDAGLTNRPMITFHTDCSWKSTQQKKKSDRVCHGGLRQFIQTDSLQYNLNRGIQHVYECVPNVTGGGRDEWWTIQQIFLCNCNIHRVVLDNPCKSRRCSGKLN
jgi:hypothetical protein